MFAPQSPLSPHRPAPLAPIMQIHAMVIETSWDRSRRCRFAHARVAGFPTRSPPLDLRLLRSRTPS